MGLQIGVRIPGYLVWIWWLPYAFGWESSHVFILTSGIQHQIYLFDLLFIKKQQRSKKYQFKGFFMAEFILMGFWYIFVVKEISY